MSRPAKKSPAKKLSAKETYPQALYPYWRYEYAKKILKKGTSADPFFNVEKFDDKEHLIVARGAWSCMLLNASPYAPGHMLVVPYRQVSQLEDLTPEESEELMDLVVAGKLLLQKELKADGINIGINQGNMDVSGGSVPSHLHWQIVPRWKADNNFMPVIAGTRLLITSQENVWKILSKAYKKLKA